MGPRSARSCVQVRRFQSKTALSLDQSQPATVRLHLVAVGDPTQNQPKSSCMHVGDFCLPLQATRGTPSFSGCPGPARISPPRTSLPVKHTFFLIISFLLSNISSCFIELIFQVADRSCCWVFSFCTTCPQGCAVAQTARCFAGWRLSAGTAPIPGTARCAANPAAKQTSAMTTGKIPATPAPPPQPPKSQQAQGESSRGPQAHNLKVVSSSLTRG